MKLIKFPTVLWLAFLLLILQTSCSKDSDLLAEYVIEDSITAEKANSPNSSSDSSSSESNNEGNSDEPNPQPENRNVEPGFFVTVNGSASNDGLTEDTAWSLQHAFATAKAGDIVYVKAGNYGSSQYTTGNSGTINNPIKFIGYTNTPGDINATTWSTYSYDDYDADGGYLPNDLMPLLKGTDLSPEWSDIAITIDDEYIWIENFMVERYSHGFRTTANHTTLINCYSNLAGDWDPANNGWNTSYSVNPPNGNLRGYGFANNEFGNHFTIKSCTVFNAGADAIFITFGDDHIGEYNSAYTDRSGNASDYLYVLWQSDRAQLTHNRAFRYLDRDTGSDLPHHSRGLAISESSNCVIDDFYIYNTRLHLQKNSSNNTLENIVINGTTEDFTGDLWIETACENNKFINTTIENGHIAFGDQGNGSYVYEPAGAPNYFINTTIENTYNQTINKGSISIRNGVWSVINPVMYSAGTQYFIGGTFNNAPFLISQDRPVDNLVFKDVLFRNMSSGFKTSIIGGPQSGSFTFSGCNFENCNFSIPEDTPVNIPGY